MKRILLDANIYGEITIDTDIGIIKGKIRNAGVIYGFRLIRNKLRMTSKSKYVGDHGFIGHEEFKRRLFGG